MKKNIRWMLVVLICMIPFQNCTPISSSGNSNQNNEAQTGQQPTNDNPQDSVPDPIAEPTCTDVTITGAKLDYSQTAQDVFFVLTNENKFYKVSKNFASPPIWVMVTEGPPSTSFTKFDVQVNSGTNVVTLFGYDANQIIWKKVLDGNSNSNWTSLNTPTATFATEFIALDLAGVYESHFLLFSPPSTAYRIQNGQLIEYATGIDRSLSLVAKDSVSENYFTGVTFDGKSIFIIRSTYNSSTQKYGSISSSLRVKMSSARRFIDYDARGENNFFGLEGNSLYKATCNYVCQTVGGTQFCSCANTDWNVIMTLTPPHPQVCK